MADVLDALTLEETKTALNIKDDDTVDDEFAAVVMAASRFVDGVNGPVVTRSVSRTAPRAATAPPPGVVSPAEAPHPPPPTAPPPPPPLPAPLSRA